MAAACLDCLLRSLGWTGSRSALLAAMPHEEAALDMLDVRNIVAELGWRAVPVGSLSSTVAQKLYPMLLETRQGNVAVLLASGPAGLTVFDPRVGTVTVKSAPAHTGRLWTFVPTPEPCTQTISPPAAWWRPILLRFRDAYLALLGITALSVLPPLALPAFTMVAFDTIIPAQDEFALLCLACGLLLILLIDLQISVARTRMHARLSARLGRIISVAVFRHLHDLSPSALETARVRQQISKLRQFDNARDLPGDAVLGTILGLIVSVPLWIFLALLIGSVVLVPLAIMLCAASAAAMGVRRLDEVVSTAASTRELRDGLADELVREAATLRTLSAGWLWRQRIHDASISCTGASIAVGAHQRNLQILGSLATQVSGYTTIFALAFLAIGGSISGGTMMASALLVWRALVPWQMLLSHLPRFVRLRREFALLDQFMRLLRETEQRPPMPFSRRYRGSLSFENVGLTYGPGAPPALLGITFQVSPGQILGIEGTSGAGKSTILKAALAMIQPQVGRILLDGIDTRQLNPREIRQRFSYLPQRSVLYSGSVRQNITIARPEATESEVQDACELANVLPDVHKLPFGFATRVNDLASDLLSPGFVQRICLARTYLAHSPFVLLDEPGRALDEDADALLRAWLKSNRGARTIVLVSHRPSHLAIADDVIRVEAGRLVPISAPQAGRSATTAQLPAGSMS